MSESQLPVPQPPPDPPQGENSKTLEQIIREHAPEVLDSIPRKNRAKLSQVLAVYQEQVSVRSVRSGPLPAPEDLAAYNQIIPQGADRIMRMAEQQSAHRISLESKVVNSQQKQAFCGQLFGLIIGLSGLGLSTFAAIRGQPQFGSIIGGSTLVSLVSVFVYARWGKKAELNKKREQMEPARQLPNPKPTK
jgi:uncharacterized membrane protein